MYISRVQIRNFRNFAAIDVALSQNAVLIGENRIGKSNFIFALRLVLDIGLPDSARQLKLTDIWDGCSLSDSPEIRIDLDFAEFDNDAGLTALLTDYRVASDHTLARLTYLLRKKAEVARDPMSEADYEFRIYGGDDPARGVRPETRRRICMEVLDALRDAEGDLGSWRSSPLRPLLDDAVGHVPAPDLEAISSDIATATANLGALAPIATLETNIRTQIADLAGTAQDIKAKFGFAPTDAARLFRAIGVYIDDGKRSIADASLGSANLALLALRLAEFAWRRQKNERNFTLACIEEPEAHLHPHLQRKVFHKLFTTPTAEPRSLFLTTHSTNIASVSPIRSLVLLKGTPDNGTKAYSLARLPLSAAELEDLQRYISGTRADILFCRGVVFVEGEAEETLIPVFTRSCGYDLDDLGIGVCNVGGVNFAPYVRLATALDLPMVVITDWDPITGGSPLGRKRALDLLDAIRQTRGEPPLAPAKRAKFDADDNRLRKTAAAAGIFLNSSTLETQIGATPVLSNAMLSVLEEEDFGAVRRVRLASWKANKDSVDPEQLLAMIADIGKGRFAGRLAVKAVGLPAPTYIQSAIVHLVGRV
jgi:putative ATP-dependent endonuclease of OLD family